MWILTSPATQKSASGSKWAGPSFTASTPMERPVSRPTTDPTGATPKNPGPNPPHPRPDGDHPQQRRHRPTYAPVPTAGCQRTPVGERRTVSDQVQHQVVRPG